MAEARHLLARTRTSSILLRVPDGIVHYFSGAREPQVEEPLLGAKSVLFEFDVDEVAEPKALLAGELLELALRYGSHFKAAIRIGASEAFVRQNCRKRSPISIKSRLTF